MLIMSQGRKNGLESHSEDSTTSNNFVLFSYLSTPARIDKLISFFFLYHNFKCIQ